MPYFIIKKTAREREADLRESRGRSNQRGIEGVVRTTEEAYEMMRQREREGLPFNKPYAVSEHAPESKQAEAEIQLRAGINPETGQSLHTHSTTHAPKPVDPKAYMKNTTNAPDSKGYA